MTKVLKTLIISLMIFITPCYAKDKTSSLFGVFLYDDARIIFNVAKLNELKQKMPDIDYYNIDISSLIDPSEKNLYFEKYHILTSIENFKIHGIFGMTKLDDDDLERCKELLLIITKSYANKYNKKYESGTSHGSNSKRIGNTFSYPSGHSTDITCATYFFDKDINLEIMLRSKEILDMSEEKSNKF